jgi:hypothetical protein
MGRFQSIQKKTQGLVGILTLACGFFMMWGSARGSVEDSITQQSIRDKAVQVDPLLPSGSNNGSVVLAAGRIFAAAQLEDELLKPGPYLILRRRVEMFQWEEEKVPLQGQVRYQLAWREGQIDFFSFTNPQGHENPLLRYQPFTKSAESATFGAFDASVLLRSVRVLLPLTLSPDLLKDPSIRIEDNKLIIPRDPNASAGTALGDMRVWYEALPQGEYTVLTQQVDERNLVGANPVEGMVMRQGLLDMDGFFAAESSETQHVSNGLLYIGGLLFFFGLCSVLSPFAERFTLRPKFPIDGTPALVIVCAGLALVAVSIFFLLGRVG